MFLLDILPHRMGVMAMLRQLTFKVVINVPAFIDLPYPYT